MVWLLPDTQSQVRLVKWLGLAVFKGFYDILTNNEETVEHRLTAYKLITFVLQRNRIR